MVKSGLAFVFLIFLLWPETTVGFRFIAPRLGLCLHKHPVEGFWKPNFSLLTPQVPRYLIVSLFWICACHLSPGLSVGRNAISCSSDVLSPPKCERGSKGPLVGKVYSCSETEGGTESPFGQQPWHLVQSIIKTSQGNGSWETLFNHFMPNKVWITQYFHDAMVT